MSFAQSGPGGCTRTFPVADRDTTTSDDRPAVIPDGGISAAELAAECTTLERAVKQLRLATEPDLVRRRPGGEENAGTTPRHWLSYYTWLHRTHAKSEHAADSTSRQRADQTLLLALADTPEHVTFIHGGHQVSVAVYPKSHEALEWFESRTRVIDWLLARRAEVSARTDYDSLMLVERTDREIAYQYQLLVVAATTPGPGLPWDPDASPDDLPEWSYDLAPTDTLAVRNAFLDVNALRLQVITEVLAPRSKDKAPPLGWATFFSIRAEEAGVPSSELLRERSLASQIAAATLAAEAKLVPFDAAETVGAVS